MSLPPSLVLLTALAAFLPLLAAPASAEPAGETPAGAVLPKVPAGSGTFPVIEASFTLTVAGNPFDFTRNDVVAVLSTPGGEVSLPAFFDGGKTWRVRHAPTAAGEYAVERVTLNGKAADVTNLQTPGFDVTGEPGRGFVRLTDSKRTFAFDDGEPYYPVGYNLGWHRGGDPALVRSIRTMGEARGNWTRIWMNHWDGKNLDWVEDHGDFPQPPLGELVLGVARKWDDLLTTAGDAGVYVQVVLQHHGQYSTDVNTNWGIHPWNRANGGWLGSPADFYTDARAVALTKAKYRYILARYGAMPGVLAWELFNEVQFTDGFKSDLPAVEAWHRDMARFVRDHDVYGHLVTTSSEIPAEGLWTEMDYYQAHAYPPDLLATIAALDARGLDRAYFFGEIGADAAGDDPAKVLETVHTVLWGSLMSRSAGAAQYWYWYLVEPAGALPQITAAQKFLDLSGLRGREDLRPIDVTVDTGRRGPLAFGPGLGWGPSTATSFAARPSGRVEGQGGMSAYLQGDNNRDLFPQADFDVDFPTAGTFAARFDELSPEGARVEASVDGRPTATVVLDPPDESKGGESDRPPAPTPLRVTLELPLDAGPHAITLRNAGKDWVHLAGFTLSDYAPEVAVLAKGDDDLVVLWAYRRETAGGEAGTVEPIGATLTLPGRPAGAAYGVTWVDTATGDATATADATADDDGALTLRPPPIARDVAAVVRRR